MTPETTKKRTHLPELEPQDQESAQAENIRPKCCRIMRTALWHSRWAVLIGLVFLALHQLEVFQLFTRSEHPILPAQ